MTGLPLKCWDPTQKVWNHGAFKEWEASVKAHLGLSGHVVVGLARFRRSDGLLMVKIIVLLSSSLH